MKSLIFVSSSHQIQSLEKYCRTNRISITTVDIVGLNIEAQLGLKHAGLSYHSSLPFFDNFSHQRCADFLAHFYNQITHNATCRINGNEYFGVVDWFAFQIRTKGVSYLVYLIELMLNAVELLQPNRVLIHESANRELDNLADTIDLFPLLLASQISNQKHIPVEYIYEPDKKTASKSFVGTIPTVDEKPIEQSRLLEDLRSKPVLLLPSLGYNLKHVVRQIRQWHPQALVLLCSADNSTFIDRIKNLQYRAKTLNLSRYKLATDIHSNIDLNLEAAYSILPSTLVYRDVGFWSFVENRILQTITESTRQLTQSSLQLINLLEQTEPRLVLSVMSNGLTYVLGEASTYLGLKALCIPHGTVSYQTELNSIEYNRLIARAVAINKYPYIAAQTPTASKFLETADTTSQIVQTGPLAFTKIRNKAFDKGKISILHAVTLKSYVSMKFWGVETTDEFISSTTDLIQAFGENDSFLLKIKLHPAGRQILSLRNWKRYFNLPHNVVIGNSDLKVELSRADILVSYSSTVIEEALINRIPVILYDKWQRYKHFSCMHVHNAEEFTPRPVIYVTNPAVLPDVVPLMVESNRRNEIDSWGDYVYPQSHLELFREYVHQSFLDSKQLQTKLP